MTTPIFETLPDSVTGIGLALAGADHGFASDTDWTNSGFGFDPPGYNQLTFNPGQAGGIDPAGVGFGTDLVGGNYGIGTSGFDLVFASDAAILPVLNIGIGFDPPGVGSAFGQVYNIGTGNGTAFDWGFATNVVGNIGICREPPGIGAAFELITYAATVVLLQDPGFWYMTGGANTVRIQETLGLSSLAQGHPTFRIIEQLGLADHEISLLQGLSIIHESLNLVDKLATIFKMIVQNQLGVTGVVKPTAIAVQTVIENLTLLGGIHSSLVARNIVIEALAMSDALLFLAKEHISEQLAFESAYKQALTARQKFVEQLALTGTALGTGRISVIVQESLALTGTITSLLQAFETIREGISFYATLNLGGDVFQAWVCNTESEAFTEYANFPFNSFMQFGGKYYGMAPDGVYLLEGADDDGTAINARIRLGLNDLGSRKEKRAPALYLLLRQDGPMLIKAISTEPDGTLREDWYQLSARGTGGVREARLKIGRGLKSVMWDWVIENVNGADFDLEGMQVFPMILDRMTRGSDG